MKESELFLNCKRYQNPIGSRPDTYSAELGKPIPELDLQVGQRVAVKGPFFTPQQAKVAVTVNKLKRSVAPDLCLLPMTVVELEADLFEESRKLRWQQYSSQSLFFLVMPDLTADLNLQTVWHKPTKHFPNGLEVVDWAQVKALGYNNSIPSAATFEESIYARDPEAGKQLLTHVLLDWVLGVGGDLALRNFIYPKQGRVYNIDTDNIGRLDWVLGNTQVADPTKRMGKHLQTFLSSNPALLDELRQGLKSLDYAQLPTGCGNVVRERAALNLDDLSKALEHQPRPKRDQSPKRK